MHLDPQQLVEPCPVRLAGKVSERRAHGKEEPTLAVDPGAFVGGPTVGATDEVERRLQTCRGVPDRVTGHRDAPRESAEADDDEAVAVGGRRGGHARPARRGRATPQHDLCEAEDPEAMLLEAAAHLEQRLRSAAPDVCDGHGQRGTGTTRPHLVSPSDDRRARWDVCSTAS